MHYTILQMSEALTTWDLCIVAFILCYSWVAEIDCNTAEHGTHTGWQREIAIAGTQVAALTSCFHFHTVTGTVFEHPAALTAHIHLGPHHPVTK